MSARAEYSFALVRLVTGLPFPVSVELDGQFVGQVQDGEPLTVQCAIGRRRFRFFGWLCIEVAEGGAALTLGPGEFVELSVVTGPGLSEIAVETVVEPFGGGRLPRRIQDLTPLDFPGVDPADLAQWQEAVAVAERKKRHSGPVIPLPGADVDEHPNQLLERMFLSKDGSSPK